MQKKRPSRTPQKKKITTLQLPYLERSESRRFINTLAKLIKNKIDVNIVPVYKSFKLVDISNQNLTLLWLCVKMPFTNHLNW